MWPVVVGVVAIAVLIRGGSRSRRERRAQRDEAHRLREMEDRRRRELGEEPVPPGPVPALPQGDRQAVA
jgi:hypothetical protein